MNDKKRALNDRPLIEMMDILRKDIFIISDEIKNCLYILQNGTTLTYSEVLNISGKISELNGKQLLMKKALIKLDKKLRKI
jgi:hypothetical protein